MLLTEQQEDNQILNIQISDLSAFTNMLFRSAEQKHWTHRYPLLH